MSRKVSTTRNKGQPLNKAKVRRAQRILGTSNEAETIERALDEVIAESRRTRLAWEANERFVKSGVQIEDVYGNLEP